MWVSRPYQTERKLFNLNNTGLPLVCPSGIISFPFALDRLLKEYKADLSLVLYCAFEQSVLVIVLTLGRAVVKFV